MTAVPIDWGPALLGGVAGLLAVALCLVLGHCARFLRQGRRDKGLVAARVELAELLASDALTVTGRSNTGARSRRHLEHVIVSMGTKLSGTARVELGRVVFRQQFGEWAIRHLGSRRHRTRGRAVMLLDVGLPPRSRAYGETMAEVSEDVTRRIIGPLTRCLSDPVPEIRCAAALVLGAVGQKGVVRQLIEATHARRSVPGAVAQRAIERMGSRAAGELEQFVESQDRPSTVIALAALGRVGDRAAAAFLEDFLTRSHSDTQRCAAFGALAHIGDIRSGLVIARVLQLEDAREVRRAAISAIGSLGHPETVEILVEAALGTDGESARIAARALASRHPEVASRLVDSHGQSAVLVASELQRATLGSAGNRSLVGVAS
jgi:hypothetical protein